MKLDRVCTVGTPFPSFCLSPALGTLTDVSGLLPSKETGTLPRTASSFNSFKLYASSVSLEKGFLEFSTNALTAFAFSSLYIAVPFSINSLSSGAAFSRSSA